MLEGGVSNTGRSNMNMPIETTARSAKTAGRLLAGLGWLVLLAGPALAVDLDSFTYGRWKGVAESDASGGFDRCTVLANFKRASGTSMRDVGTAIMIDKSNGWRIGFIEPGVSVFGRGEPYRLGVDGKPVLEAKPDATADQMAVLALGGDPKPLFGSLRQGNVLTVHAADELYELPLAGIGRALDWLDGCVDRYKSFVPPGREKAAAESLEVRRDIAGLMGRLLEAASARDVRIGPPAGTPEFPSEDKSVVWRAGGLEGSVQVWAGKSAKSLADDIVKSNSGCTRRPTAPAKGAPAKPPAKSAGKAKPDPVALAVVDCEDPLGARRIGLVLLPRPKGGIYQITVTARAEESPDEVDRLGEKLAEAARAVLAR
jgi:hypothetical protein